MADPLGRLQAALAHTYQVERELGQGGMATVYLAHDRKHVPARGTRITTWRPMERAS
jgi:serine/threonine protein kinase